MFVYKILSAVRDVEGLSGPQKAIYSLLATYTNNQEGTDIYPGLALLSRKSGFSERCIRNVLNQLEKDGWIKSEQSRKGHVRGWALCLEKLGIQPGDIKPIKKGGQPQPPASVPAADDPPPYERGLPAAASTVPPNVPATDGELSNEEYERELAKARDKVARRRRALQAFQMD